MKIITSIHNEKLFILILFFNTSGNHKKNIYNATYL
nr:MAG TPA: hypothetical protein [Caudoviricetes sp.]